MQQTLVVFVCLSLFEELQQASKVLSGKVVPGLGSANAGAGGGDSWSRCVGCLSEVGS